MTPLIPIIGIYLAGITAAFFTGRAYERSRWQRWHPRLPHEDHRFLRPPPAFRDRPPTFRP